MSGSIFGLHGLGLHLRLFALGCRVNLFALGCHVSQNARGNCSLCRQSASGLLDRDTIGFGIPIPLVNLASESMAGLCSLISG